MIRINLLPVRQEKQAAAGRTWIAVFAVAVLLEAIVVFVVDTSARASLEEKTNRNAAVRAQIDQINRQTADLEQIRARLERSQQLEAVVNRLQRARTGPTRVLLELARILSAGRGPSIDPARLEEIRRQNPLAGFNAGWNHTRLWMTEFREENREIRMVGLGRTNEDVAELLHRLELSDYFYDVALTKTEEEAEEISGQNFIKFELTAKVRY
ncbi:MAG: PilN domain-containing protein [Deltaproteobacteria bacterium]|nr:PilN domain-containing protein [Deltaproteobacteria bacterium]